MSITGNALYYQGLFEESIEYFTKDLQICKATGDHCGEGDCYSNIGTVYFALGQIEKSVEYRKRALQIMKELGLRDGERWVNPKLRHKSCKEEQSTRSGPMFFGKHKLPRRDASTPCR